MQPILREEIYIAVASLKKGKSAGVDNIPAEHVQASGETMVSLMVFYFVLSLFPRDVLDEIWD